MVSLACMVNLRFYWALTADAELTLGNLQNQPRRFHGHTKNNEVA